MSAACNRWIRTGDFEAFWQPEACHLRYISLGGVEILRGVYFAVRDADWGTVKSEIVEGTVSEHDGDWRIGVDLRWQEGEVDFAGSLSIRGSASGTIDFVFAGEAGANFASNRIGFLILHPADAAGERMEVESATGEVLPGHLPEAIAPDPVFTDIRALRHWPAAGLEICVRMKGEVFEMEDQRNWTDASFKTYSTPLSEPYPRKICAGQRIEQSVSVRIRRTAEFKPVDRAEAARVEVIPDMPSLPLPNWGFEFCPGSDAGDPETLAACHPDHLRIEVFAAEESWKHALGAATDFSGSLNLPLEAVLFLDPSALEQADAVVDALLETGLVHARWIVLDTEAKVSSPVIIERVARRLRTRDAQVPLFVGTDAFFTEINREQPPLGEAAGMAFSMNPTVHADDKLSMVETLSVQGTCVHNALALGAQTVVVSPVTFRTRRNSNATTPEGFVIPESKQKDNRQWSAWGAVWTLGSFKYLAEAGARSVTYFKTGGPTGLCAPGGAADRENQPLVNLFRHLASWKGAEVVPSKCNRMLEAFALFLRRNDKTAVFLANPTETSQSVEIAWGRFCNTCTVGPHAIEFIDCNLD